MQLKGDSHKIFSQKKREVSGRMFDKIFKLVSGWIFNLYLIKIIFSPLLLCQTRVFIKCELAIGGDYTKKILTNTLNTSNSLRYGLPFVGDNYL